MSAEDGFIAANYSTGHDSSEFVAHAVFDREFPLTKVGGGKMRTIFIALITLVYLAVQPAPAQVLTGTLFGTVKDASGAVLPLNGVRVTSAALISGVASTVTNDRGQFRLPQLPPGLYNLEVFSSGFESYREEDIRVGVGASIERDVVLHVAGISESIDVVTSRSSLDALRTGLTSRFDSADLKNIPVRRYSMFDFIKAAPGMSPTSATSGTNNILSAFGGGGNENAFLLDGANFTCPCSGGAAPQPDVDVIE